MSKRVLIADDEPDLRFLVELILTPEGHEVLEAANGEQALAMIKEHHPDLILLDANMPIIDGWTVLEELRSNGDLESLQVIMVTASVTTAVADRAFQAGCTGYLGKPFSPDELREIVSSGNSVESVRRNSS
jgi:CheY-like chemotaxis protein